MKILFCSPVQKSKELGGSKVVVELAEAMQQIGWDCQTVCPSDFPAPSGKVTQNKVFHEQLRTHLLKHADNFDVIDYDHSYLPFARKEFSSQPLFVARSVLLTHHLLSIPVPKSSGLRAVVGILIKGNSRRREMGTLIKNSQKTVEEADIVNVSNFDDKAELIKNDIPADKIVVIPYGISTARRILFDQISSQVPRQPVIAFVGTFDYRKGAKEFPEIVHQITEAVPNVRFRLLGAQGLFRTEAEILSRFPRGLRERVEVVLRYKSDELPQLLSDCALGIFPSYIEGMPFGVLEMLAASVPVIAYDSPGPPMMLPAEYLVPRGDTQKMSEKVITLLRNESSLQNARIWAKQQSQQFCWQEIAKTTAAVYQDQLQRKRSH